MELIPIMDDQNRRGDSVILGSPATSPSGFVWARDLRAGLVALALAGASAPAAQGAPAWQYSANTNVAFTLTDNVLLASEDALAPFDPQTDFITSLTAGAQANSQTRAGTINFNYQLSYDHYIDTDQLNGFRHNLTTQSNLVLVDDVFFVDVRGSIGERSANRTLRRPGTARTINGNQSLVMTSSISPYVATTLADRFLVNARLDYSRVDFRKANVSTASRQPDNDGRLRGSFQVSNVDQGKRLNWQVFGNTSLNNDDLEQHNIGASLGLSVSETTELVARGGYDATSGRRNVRDIEDAYWRVGFNFQPIRDSYVQLEAGERYGAPSYDANVRYIFSKFLTLNATYRQTLESSQSQLMRFLNSWEAPVRVPGSMGITLEDPFSPFYGLDLDGDIFDELTLNDTARATLSGSLGRIGYSVTATYRIREYGEIEGVGGPWEEELASVNVNVSRGIGKRTRVGISGAYADEESDLPILGFGPGAINFAREIDSRNGQIYASMQLSPTAQAMMSFTHSEREDGGGRRVNENALMFTLSKTW
jgi:uncharacterized protein (PEP-CTERM system associated)